MIGGDESDLPNRLDDDSDTIVPNPADFRELFGLVTGLFPQAQGESERAPPPPFILQEGQDEANSVVFARFKLYERLTRVKEDVAIKVKSVAKEAKKPSSVLPRKRGLYRVAGDDNVALPSQLNDLFSHITTTKPSANASILIQLEELRRLEASLANLQETQSFSFWLVAALFAYIRENGFVAPDSAFFSRLTSSLSLALVDQAKLAFSMSAFLNMSRRNHCLKFAAPSVTAGQKARLLGSDPFGSDLFDPNVLKEVSAEFDGDAATSSNLSVVSLVAQGALSVSSGVKRKSEVLSGGSAGVVVPPSTSASTSASGSVGFSERPSSAKSPKSPGRGGRRGRWFGRGRGRSYGPRTSRGFWK